MRRPLQSRSGTSLIEGALFIPFVVLLLVGMMEAGRVTYTYYQLQKTVYSVARFAGTQQNINLCDSSNDVLTQAISLGRTGTGDAGEPSVILGLQASDFRVRVERYNVESDSIEECDCSSNGCDTSQGGSAPNYLSVDLVNGYPFTFKIPGVSNSPIILRPSVRLPFGGS